MNSAAEERPARYKPRWRRCRHCESGMELGGRPGRVTDSQIRSAVRLVEGGEPAAQVTRDLGMSQATFYRRPRALPNQQAAI
ncbi:helix-turn-helix domain-containing protein [Arthrobacter sp. B1I2]|uniref:helix-turn-helix domain-containing protein n=1 Tax=Arthrobacter sp. B1I2 TaxID=3042263 RepID=UPI0035936A40